MGLKGTYPKAPVPPKGDANDVAALPESTQLLFAHITTAGTQVFTVEGLARDLRLSPWTVRRGLARLEEAGLLEIRTAKNGFLHLRPAWRPRPLPLDLPDLPFLRQPTRDLWRWLAQAGGRIVASLREVARTLDISPTTARRSLDFLAAQGILTIRRYGKGRATRYVIELRPEEDWRLRPSKNVHPRSPKDKANKLSTRRVREISVREEGRDVMLARSGEGGMRVWSLGELVRRYLEARERGEEWADLRRRLDRRWQRAKQHWSGESMMLLASKLLRQKLARWDLPDVFRRAFLRALKPYKIGGFLLCDLTSLILWFVDALRRYARRIRNPWGFARWFLNKAGEKLPTLGLWYEAIYAGKPFPMGGWR